MVEYFEFKLTFFFLILRVDYVRDLTYWMMTLLSRNETDVVIR